MQTPLTGPAKVTIHDADDTHKRYAIVDAEGIVVNAANGGPDWVEAFSKASPHLRLIEHAEASPGWQYHDGEFIRPE